MRKLTHRLAESEKAYDELKVKYKESLTKRRELTEQLMEITENNSFDEADMGALVEEVEKLKKSKENLRRELEALTIRMIQELENHKKAEDLVKDKEHEIFKLNQEIGTLTAYLQEDLSKELAETKEIFAKFNQSTTKLDQHLESMKSSRDTTGLGYSTQVEGESSGTKTDAPKGKPVPVNANKRKEKEDVEQELIKYLCDNDRSPTNIKSVISKSFYKSLNNKWRIAIEKEQAIREEIVAQYFLDASNSELLEILDQYKDALYDAPVDTVHDIPTEKEKEKEEEAKKKAELEELRKKKEQDVIQIVIDTLSNLVPSTNLSGTDSLLAKLKLLCIVVDDEVQSLEADAQATARKNHEKELNVALVQKIAEDRTTLIHQKDDISLAMAEGNHPDIPAIDHVDRSEDQQADPTSTGATATPTTQVACSSKVLSKPASYFYYIGDVHNRCHGGTSFPDEDRE
ncbi:uncharacterized protein LOC131040020 [Cryptomeria japonica]|uniref:uncharacterized protein LOC131040020 n=1 Tax=Cryptomeria japonica TaxID=3369 RepID=UPI0025AC37CF|nr:uncharacterized protein LOC131040020 [Cryptomeria japonica]